MAGLWRRAVSNLLIPWLKEYLKQKGIQSSGKHKVELEELCEKSRVMKSQRLLNKMKTPVNQRISMKEQLKTDEGDLESPLEYKNLNGPKILLLSQTLDFPIFNLPGRKISLSLNAESLKWLQISCGVQVVF